MIFINLFSSLWLHSKNPFCIYVFVCSYTGCPKKADQQIPYDLKVWYSFSSWNKASFAEENDTKIIEFGWIILILCPFFNTVIFTFRLIFATDDRRIVSGMAFHMAFLGKPIDPCHQNKRCKRKTGIWKAYPDAIIYVHWSQKSSEIWKWPYFKKWAFLGYNQNYSTKFNDDDLGIILFCWRCFI